MRWSAAIGDGIVVNPTGARGGMIATLDPDPSHTNFRSLPTQALTIGAPSRVAERVLVKVRDR
jgi:hypothetical protein